MEDMERYGDYNEVDGEDEGKKGVLGIIIKLLIGAVLVGVIGVIAFRIFIFNTYPSEVSELIMTDKLEDFLVGYDGTPEAFSQSAQARYDDPKEGNFFFDHLVVIPEADHIQFAVRYNESFFDSVKKEFGVEIDPASDPFEIFDFKLVMTERGYQPPEDGTTEPVPLETVGSLGAATTATSFMYRYLRLAFDEVDLGLGEGETPVGWVRLDITLKDPKVTRTYSLPVYQPEATRADYKLDYKLAEAEK
ncbi:MAG: hypothetical protein IKC32_04815 [Clostridia bacterium]|nr:hypothetical protein [Clostridia bacterium]